MAKKQTKKALQIKWSGKIKEARALYNEARQKNKSLPAFKNTDGFKYLSKQKEKAFVRFENRDKINEVERQKYAIRKEVEKEKKAGGLEGYDNVTMFEAFSGKGRIFEESVLRKSKELDFAGVVNVSPIEGEKTTRTFTNYSSFKMYINRFLDKMYEKAKDIDNEEEEEETPENKKDRYVAFKWSIERSYKREEKRLLIEYTITQNEP